MLFVPLLALFFALPAAAEQPHEQEIQRALIELDRRSADFGRGTPSQPPGPFVGRPLDPDPEVARQLRPYERMREAEKGGEPYVLRLPPPVVRDDSLDKARPLPAAPEAGVAPVTNPSARN